MLKEWMEHGRGQAWTRDIKVHGAAVNGHTNVVKVRTNHQPTWINGAGAASGGLNASSARATHSHDPFPRPNTTRSMHVHESTHHPLPARRFAAAA